VLLALTAGAAMQVFARQKESNTQLLVQTVANQLHTRWAAVAAQARKESIPPQVLNGEFAPNGNRLTWGLLDLAGGNLARARVIWVKLRLKQEFPMNYAEARTPTPPTLVYASPAQPGLTLPAVLLPPNPTFARALANVPAAPQANPAEASACLLLALESGRGTSGAFSGDSLGGAALGDTNGDGLREIIDPYEKPLAFWRWPAGNPEVDASNPAPANTRSGQFRDPFDPDGLLMEPAWWADVRRGIFERLCHPVSDQGRPRTFYLVPVVASSGRNGLWGVQPTPALEPDLMRVAGPDADDNIYSYRLRVGGRGE